MAVIIKKIGLFALIALTGSLAACKKDTPSVAQGAEKNRSSAEERCYTESPYLAVGAGIDAPSNRLEVDAPLVGKAATCSNNNQFRFGSGIYDITGVVANTNGMGWEAPEQVFGGIHQRLHARAFAMESPCNNKRVMVVVADVALLTGSLRENVLNAIAANPELASRYGPDNIMLSATHTHQGPAGYSKYLTHNVFHFGFDADTFKVTADGLYEAIKMADANLKAHPETAGISLASGELLNTNIQRSPEAYEINGADERREFINTRGEEVKNNKRVVQINFQRNNGSEIGILNWFGVHGTVVGKEIPLVSSDNKGFAATSFERLKRTNYTAKNGIDNFVAAFAQAEEGDSSPNIYMFERPYPDPTRGGGKDVFESNAISGTKQLVKALNLLKNNTPVIGPIDYRLMNVKMDGVTVTDPVVMASLKHSQSLDSAVKKTCSPAVGASQIGSAEDNPGQFSKEGLSCRSSNTADLAAAMQDNDLVRLIAEGQKTGYPRIPLGIIAAPAQCTLKDAPPSPATGDLSCQAEKPILLPLDTAAVLGISLIVPMQIVRIGNLAIIGLPWEVTTMSGRRIRKQMLDVLSPVGVNTIVVASLTNDYVHYLTTREEYSSQQYEGAATLFGPWSLAAVQQELRRIAIAMRDGKSAPESPRYVDGNPILIRPPYIPSDIPVPSSFGAVVSDVPAKAKPGETVSATFQAGHPRNDLRTQASYVYVERQNADKTWAVVAEDRDHELLFIWRPSVLSPFAIDLPIIAGLSSTAEAVWNIPKNTPAGTYRLRYEGAAQSFLFPLEKIHGISSAFELSAPVSSCP